MGLKSPFLIGSTFVRIKEKMEGKIMKTILTLFVSFLSVTLLAQSVNISFAGANQNKNFQVVIDGVSYYSVNSEVNNGRRVINIPSLTTGSHTLEVYSMGNNNNVVYTDGTTNSPIEGEEIYSKTFQLRTGYDMNINIRPNGMVSFTESKSLTQNKVQYGSNVPMSSTAFNQLLVNVRNKRYQSQKIAMIRSAFNTTANYFTTNQVRQLLVLVTAESRRIELAKLSYKKVTDPDNFTYVYDVIKSEAGRDALDDYIVEQGGSTSTTDDNAALGTAMSVSNFNQLMVRIQNQNYEEGRISEIRNALNSSYNYFSTAQIKQILLLVSSETDRISLAKLAFIRTADKANFNQLVDIFYTQNNRDDLNKFIISNGGVANNSSYRSAMSDASFAQVYNKARSHFFQKNTLNDIRTAFNTTSNNFTTAQVKQLLMLATNEADKLALAKLSYPRVVDTINFSQIMDLFSIESNRTELDIFIKAQ